ncbi:MAG: hypothetical protein O3A14_13540 [Cyanobacteria bacterium]|nr:hypothetical protein [Cyanobacteriota bacterium]
MTDLKAAYARAFADNCQLDPDAWFEDDTPQEQLALLDQLVVSSEVAETMLLAGETDWSHLAWWKDVYLVLRQWCHHPLGLIKTRLVATWLLSTVPHGYCDASCAAILRRLSQGQCGDVFAGLSSHWPRKPEFYLQHGQWQVTAFAEDADRQDWATANAALYQRTGKVIGPRAA